MTTGQAPTRKTFEASGIAKAAEESGAELVNFDITGVKAVEVDGPIKTLYIAKPVLEADIVINLPKLKTHSAAVYTGAVKNMFGCIPGARKAEYHRKLPKLKDFSGLLVDIYKVARPSLAIMDAIVGMEGNGPSAGNPREIGLILASGDGVALDAVASSIIGLKPLRIHTTSIAHQRGIGNGDIDLIEIAGEKLNDVKIKGFNVPTNALLETMPGFLIKGVLSLMKAVPEINQTACAGCRFCVESCPVGAMKMSGKSPVIDYNKCISCLCCQELCPRKAVELKPANRLGRLIYTFAGHRKIKN